MKIIALQNFDSYKEGQAAEVPDGYGRAVVQKGLAKMAGDYLNKMQTGVDNKGNVYGANGEKSSVLPAAPASPKQTAKQSRHGGRPKKAAP